MMIRRAALFLAGALLVLLLACGGNNEPAATTDGDLRGTLTVFAATSLQDAFNELAAGFREQNAAVRVEFNYAGSPTLRAQLEQGARADVFASANLAQMELAVKNDVVEPGWSIFARNSLVIITPSDNRARIEGPADLARPGLKLAIASPEVPAGAYTRQMLASMELDPTYGRGFTDRVGRNVVSLESNVKQVVAKVELGEADAGVVYGTDVTASVAGRIRTIMVPDRFNVMAAYTIGLVEDASNKRAGQAFIDFVMSQRGQDVLKKHGFLNAG
jgi:molybdate transport system substrate-binding protein